MSDLKSVRVVRTFTYDPELFLEMNSSEEDAARSQDAFEEYAIECAVEDFGCGRGGLTILPSAEDEEDARAQLTLDALCVWEWYIEESKVHLLPDVGAYEKRQLVIDQVTPAVNDAWETFEKLTGSPYPDSFDWEFIPAVLSAWHNKGAEEFMQLVESRIARVAWLGGFIEEVKAKEQKLNEERDARKD